MNKTSLATIIGISLLGLKNKISAGSRNRDNVFTGTIEMNYRFPYYAPRGTDLVVQDSLKESIRNIFNILARSYDEENIWSIYKGPKAFDIARKFFHNEYHTEAVSLYSINVVMDEWDYDETSYNEEEEQYEELEYRLVMELEFHVEQLRNCWLSEEIVTDRQWIQGLENALGDLIVEEHYDRFGAHLLTELTAFNIKTKSRIYSHYYYYPKNFKDLIPIFATEHGSLITIDMCKWNPKPNYFDDKKRNLGIQRIGINRSISVINMPQGDTNDEVTSIDLLEVETGRYKIPDIIMNTMPKETLALSVTVSGAGNFNGVKNFFVPENLEKIKLESLEIRTPTWPWYTTLEVYLPENFWKNSGLKSMMFSFPNGREISITGISKRKVIYWAQKGLSYKVVNDILKMISEKDTNKIRRF